MGRVVNIAGIQVRVGWGLSFRDSIYDQVDRIVQAFVADRFSARYIPEEPALVRRWDQHCRIHLEATYERGDREQAIWVGIKRGQLFAI